MSYILDALRKADAERERGEIPGLHAQVTPSAETTPPPATAASHRVWIVAGATAVLTVVASWMIFGRGPEPAPPPAMPGPMGMQTMPPTAPMAQPVQPDTPPVVPPQATMAPPPAPPTIPPTAYYPPVNTAPPTATGSAGDTAGMTKSEVIATQPATPTTTAQTTTAPRNEVPKAEVAANKSADKGGKSEAGKLYKLMDLPESVRRDLPTLTIGGAMYSEIPAQRMLIINSQVLREGDTVAPELVLEAIQLKAAIFRFKGYRYIVNY